MMLSSGTRLGPYEIQAALGAGGMGEVYRARDTRLDRAVAIKILPAEFSSQPELQQRFEREARVISSLSHPHICALFDVGVQDGLHYLVMECLQGESLAQRLRKGPVPIQGALRIATEIAEALECAHHNGVTHRDLKPSNIVLTRDGAKLLDFGLAKVARPALADPATAATLSDPLLTKEGTLTGTLPYMAPEQVEGRAADARTDIFALGNVIYEMVTGRPAFAGGTQANLIATILSSEPPPIRASVPSAPTGLDRVVQACMAKKPDERWQSAHDLKLELEWLARSPQGGVEAPDVAPKAGMRERLAWSSAMLLLVIAALLAMIHFHSSAPTAQAVRASLLPPTGSSFVSYNFAVSPDGSRLAFVAVNADGHNTLWVRSLSAASAQQFNGTEDAKFPFWSPDNRHIGFFAEAKLKTLDIGDGAVRVLCDARAGRGGTWNRDGTIVFAPLIIGPLYRISESGGMPAAVTRIARQGSGQAHRWPFFLPDGKHFLYFVDWSAPGDEQGNGIYAGSTDGSEAKLVSSELAGNVAFVSGRLLYVRDRSLVAQAFDPERLAFSGPGVSVAEQEVVKDVGGFSQSGFSPSQNGVLVFQSAADSSSRLTWFDASGKEMGELPGLGYWEPRFSPDGRFLVASSDDARDGKHYVRVYDLERGISTRLTDGGSEESPAWSRDGKRIAYVGHTGNTYYMYEVAADGSRPPQVLVKGAKMLHGDWSPDDHLVFLDFGTGRPHLSVYSAADRQVSESAAGAEPRFSPDGKWVAYTGAGVYGDIFVQPFPGPGGRIQISSAGGTQPVWSRDSRQIFYIAPDKKLMAVSFDPEKKSASAPHVLFQTRIVAPNFVGHQYDVAPDGRFLINSLPSNYASPLTLLTGWDAHLER